MQQAADAYNRTAKQALTPLELEANLLLKAARKLQLEIENWNPDGQTLDQALLYNRKLWTIFVTSVTDPNHPLPPQIRQNIANIGIFIFNRTLDIQMKPEPEKLKALVNINRQIAAGLSGNAGDAPAA